ncbi:DUF3048 domain-containing protein [Candidatus Formimonas warabiya]|uniref:DUF3048 domain-containing protein n=1 Tax=Formimonas warabiya TaxID=1761012 RepID=A0A3G1KY30_FORW1|nr:DUF3048 domain-containing protein [Candidatus Formimonas warabiya]ATW27320.1 hypothetical protein DCMF_23495 [Candidatus Formimonas warabiya]
MKPRGRYKLMMILLTVLFLGICTFIYLTWAEINSVSQVVKDDNSTEETGDQDPIYAYVCPFDGTPLEKMPARPVAVTIDNLFAARPQSGLTKADLVYEIPAEGGVTRFLAIYFHGQAEKIGPVRSARPYLASLAQDWDAVFIHAGESPQAQIYFKNEDLDHINEMFHPAGFWRDKSRKAPHNLYTSSENLGREIALKGWDEKVEVPGFSFRAREEAGAGNHEALQATIHYAYGDVIYKYDQASGLYRRYLGDKPHQDKETEEQLSAANILVQETKIRAFDEEGRLEIDLQGEGKVWLFSGGQVEEGRWIKDAEHQPTRFVDVYGNEFRFLPGQTWIEIIPQNTRVEY